MGEAADSGFERAESMNAIAHHILQVFGWFVGSLLLYAGLFLYEDEQKHLQNRLEELWIRIHDRSKGAASAFNGFTIETSRIAEQVFNRTFGPRILSWQVVAISSCFATASVELSVLPFSDNYTRQDRATAAAIYLGLGALPALIRSPWATLVAIRGWVASLTLALIGLLFFTDFIVFEAHLARIVSVVILPPLMDILWIYGCRALLAKAASVRTASLIFAWNVITVGLCLIPLMHPFELENSNAPVWLVEVVETFVRTRWFLATCASILLIVAVVAILHLYTWPIFARLVYRLQSLELFSKPKVLVGTGLALIGLSSGAIKWFEFLSKVGG